MIKLILTIIIFTIPLIIGGCGEEVIVETPRQPISDFSPPEDFRPSRITQDENGAYWGLFVSRRLSAKDNIWVVKSGDRKRWIDPVLVMNAYFASAIDFEVRNDSLHFVFYEIDPGYFLDYGLGLGDFVDYKDECEISFALSDLTYDRDNDGLYDNIEEEILTSNRLPDTDLDGKPDQFDTNPISKPAVRSRNHQIYEAVLENIIHTAGLDTITVRNDKDWSKYYGLYYLAEPYPLYLSFSSEQSLFELAGFPMPLIIVKNPLWYGSRIRYTSSADGVIPHINFRNITIKPFVNQAEVIVETYFKSDMDDEFEFLVDLQNGLWTVKGVTKIEPIIIEEEQVSDSTTETP